MSLTPENEEEDRQMDIPVESPEEALAERISLEEVLHALPEQDRQLIRLRFYGNKTQSETAKVLHTTQAADRPGVTRANQWVKVGPYLELLDTPGMLWPKLDNQDSARVLAFLGSIRDQIMDGEELAGQLLERLMALSPQAAGARFKLEGATSQTPGHALLEMACRGRGWLMAGGRMDTERGAALVLDEFRAGRVGRVTLEPAPN